MSNQKNQETKLTKEQTDQMDRYIEAINTREKELKKVGIMFLYEHSEYQDRDVSYGMNFQGNKIRLFRLPIINAKNKQSVFNSNQIAMIKRYEGGYDDKTRYWYVKNYLLTEF